MGFPRWENPPQSKASGYRRRSPANFRWLEFHKTSCASVYLPEPRSAEAVAFVNARPSVSQQHELETTTVEERLTRSEREFDELRHEVLGLKPHAKS
jgi:hypothetical protein